MIKTKDGRILNTQDIFSIEPLTTSEVTNEWATRNYTADEWAEMKEQTPYGRTVRNKVDMPIFHTVDLPIAGYRVTSNSGMCMFIHPDDYKKLLDVLQWDDDQQVQSSGMQGLTQDVFSSPYCPDWAEYAAIDGNGNAYYYEERPSTGYAVWIAGPGGRTEFIGDVGYKGWRNSLIKRER